ncbi:hypothetical protein GCM10027290_61560 [Micromonospora sonneratiae]|uniref:WXG100 family type VII secretion target n=1 Tax=Micromonospora sonneratiae TaxID=1184706 RepID=A0ABW3YPD3_9ACTN
MTAYEYDKEDLLNVIEYIRATHNKIDTALDDFETAAETKLASWDGDAKMLYLQCKANWERHINEMAAILTTKAAPGLRNVLDNYNLTERVNSARWQEGA